MKKIILPSFLDIEKVMILANNQYVDNSTNHLRQYEFNIKTLKLESINYILFIIFRSTIFKLNALNEIERTKYITQGKFKSNDFYIELPSSTLVKIDRNYKQIMDFLTNKHLNYENILFRKNYEKGKSFSYCINPHYINDQFNVIEISKKSIIKHMNEVYQPKVSGSLINRVFIGLKNDFQNNFSIDFSGLSTNLDNSKLISDYNSILGMIDYNNGKKWMSLNPEKDGRLHTNFTIMSSKYRKLIKNKKNDEFVEIDVGACIPYLFIMSIMNSTSAFVEFNGNDHLKQYWSLFKILNDKALEYKTINFLVNEIKIMLEALNANSFYQLFPSLSKIDILSFFFCKNGSKPEIENTIKSTFPNFCYYVYQMKNNLFWVEQYKFPPKYDCNELLAHYLFHLESTVMLHNISKKVKSFKRNINLITIHDCLMVPKQYAEEVKNIMEEEFIYLLKLKPIIKIKGLP